MAKGKGQCWAVNVWYEPKWASPGSKVRTVRFVWGDDPAEAVKQLDPKEYDIIEADTFCDCECTCGTERYWRPDG